MFLLHPWLLAFLCLSGFAFGANPPIEEFESLQEIAKTLGKQDWDLSVDPCNTTRREGSEYDTITCDCSFVNNTVCHVISISIHQANGIVPLTNLTNLFTRSQGNGHFHYRRILGSSTISRKSRVTLWHVAAGVLVILLVVVLLWWRGCFRRKITLEYELKGVDLQTGSFTLRQIKAATNNFDPANRVGEGGFGLVYKGTLSDGTAIAVKQLSSKSKQGHREFVTEIGMISALEHPHLVRLYGCCIDGNQLLLIYEYMEKNSLARALFGPKEDQLNLNWPTRYKICIGVARGLVYLHEESTLKIIHRDIKATNVLLDGNLFPKISDFGLARLHEEENTHISTRIAGTYGYMAPEYAMRGYLTDKADIYSFGVVLLEVVAGRSNVISKMQDEFNLVDWANSLNQNGNLMELVDPRLKLNSNKEVEEITTTIKVALHCTTFVPTERPTMSTVLSMLEGRVVAADPNPSMKNTLKMRNNQQATDFSIDEVTECVSTDAPWTGTTSSSVDLYPIAVDSEFWNKRAR